MDMRSESPSSDQDIGHACKDKWTNFSNRLRRFESPADLELLYPRRLWDLSRAAQISKQEGNFLHDLPSSPHEVADKDGFEQVDATDFSVYNSISAPQCAGQYQTLDVVMSDCKSDPFHFYVDATLESPNGSPSVTCMEIVDCSIGGLSLNEKSSKSYIWVQTKAARAHNTRLWYRLVTPASGYRSLWQSFEWLADLLKHFVDFLSSHEQDISLEGFESDFIAHTKKRRSGCSVFYEWHKACGLLLDFRHHVIQYSAFLNDQITLLGEDKLMQHSVWKDVGMQFNRARSKADYKDERTLVSPFVYHCFMQTFPRWAAGQNSFDLLEVYPRSIHDDVIRRRENRRSQRGFPQSPMVSNLVSSHDFHVDTVREKLNLDQASPDVNLSEILHKVVIVMTTKFVQKQQLHHVLRYALVVRVANNRKMLHIRWLTTASETFCRWSLTTEQLAYYPIKNELFFSDECSCNTIDFSAVKAIMSVSIPTHSTTTGLVQLIVRKRYRKTDCAIIDFIAEDLQPICVDPECRRSIDKLRVVIRRSSEYKVASTVPSLHSFSIFSGCGLFDSAIEACNLVETVSSVDLDEGAILSIKANRDTRRKEPHHLAIDSVSCMLRAHIEGKGYQDDLEADCVITGSPCQGFSRLNGHREKRGAARNCSFIAQVVSYVELILPRFVVIENVPAMKEDSPACAQTVACLVALGYQVRTTILKAQNYGGATKRRRVFVLAAAPGHVLPNVPERMFKNEEDFVTIEDVIGDLPPTHNDALSNIRHPDHIPIKRLKTAYNSHDLSKRDVNQRDILHKIPTTPPQMNLARSLVYLTPPQLRWYQTLSKEKQHQRAKTFQRIDRKGQFDAILTSGDGINSRGGCVVHYDQDRLITVLECRRAQGVPDDYILVGTLQEQLKQVGNCVPRALGVAIGRALGDAWKQVWSSFDNPQRVEFMTARASRGSHEEVASVSTPAILSAEHIEIESETELSESAQHETVRQSPGGTIEYERTQRKRRYTHMRTHTHTQKYANGSNDHPFQPRHDKRAPKRTRTTETGTTRPHKQEDTKVDQPTNINTTYANAEADPGAGSGLDPNSGSNTKSEFNNQAQTVDVNDADTDTDTDTDIDTSDEIIYLGSRELLGHEKRDWY